MDEILPNALTMGVTYDLFWELNPVELLPFVKAFSVKLKYDDKQAWQQGLYVRLAFASCNDKKCKYPDHPIIHDKSFIETEEDKQKRIRDNFVKHAMALNSKFRKGN